MRIVINGKTVTDELWDGAADPQTVVLAHLGLGGAPDETVTWDDGATAARYGRYLLYVDDEIVWAARCVSETEAARGIADVRDI